MASYKLTPQQQAFVDKAEEEGFEVDYSYSGPGMFGEQWPTVRCRLGQFGFKGASGRSG